MSGRATGADALGAAFGALAAVPSEVAQLRADVRGLREVVERLGERLPPAPMLSMAGASTVTGLSISSIKRMIRDGRIRAIRLGRQVRIDARDLRPLSHDEVIELAAKARGR